MSGGLILRDFPREPDPRDIEFFLRSLRQLLTTDGGVNWDTISKVGSDLADLETRLHIDLQSQDGDPNFVHFTQTEKNNILFHIASSSGVHGITGDVLGTTDTQLVSNKIIAVKKRLITATPTAALLTDHVIDVDTSSIAITINLPLISTTIDGFALIIIDGANNAGGNTITINAAGSDTILGGAAETITSDNGVVRIFSDTATSAWKPW